jgi:hypothetical protein
MSGCGARPAAGSLKAVFESSDVERFAWVLMEVSAAKISAVGQFCAIPAHVSDIRYPARSDDRNGSS